MGFKSNLIIVLKGNINTLFYLNTKWWETESLRSLQMYIIDGIIKNVIKN